MADRIGIVFGAIGFILSSIFFSFFAKLAYDGMLTWAFWPTTLFVIVGCLPYAAGRTLKFIMTGR